MPVYLTPAHRLLEAHPQLPDIVVGGLVGVTRPLYPKKTYVSLIHCSPKKHYIDVYVRFCLG